VNADYFYINFENVYTSAPDPNQATATQYTSSGNTAAKGFEGEANLYLYKGLSFYVNGTVGTSKYVTGVVPTVVPVDGLVNVVNPNLNKWVASTPGDTEGFGLTYQQKYLDFGFFNKRIGSLWNDGTSGTTYVLTNAADPSKTYKQSITLNQYVPINSFNLTNLFFNFTMRKGSFFDQSKLRLSFNNLFDT